MKHYPVGNIPEPLACEACMKPALDLLLTAYGLRCGPCMKYEDQALERIKGRILKRIANSQMRMPRAMENSK